MKMDICDTSIRPNTYLWNWNRLNLKLILLLLSKLLLLTSLINIILEKYSREYVPTANGESVQNTFITTHNEYKWMKKRFFKCHRVNDNFQWILLNRVIVSSPIFRQVGSKFIFLFTEAIFFISSIYTFLSRYRAEYDENSSRISFSNIHGIVKSCPRRCLNI